MALKIKKKNILSKIKLCNGCELRQHTKNLVVGKGCINAELLFIGEGTDKSEDLLCELIIGNERKLLDFMIEDACELINRKIVPFYYVTNIVLCRPWIWDYMDSDYGKFREPSKQEVLSCMKNILDIVYFIKPKQVVFFGRVAEKYYTKEFPNAVRVMPPALHLKYGGKSSPTYYQDVRILSEVLKGK